MITVDRLADALRQELTAAFPDRRLLGAWLYGSHARGEAHSDSDIDVGVLSDEPLDSVSLFDVSGRLAARLGAAVDLVDLRRAGGLLRRLDPAIVRTVVEHRLGDFEALCRDLMAAS